MISVLMITYNHEKFIHEAIEGVVRQKVSIPIELVIGEDFSTDETRKICEWYQQRYPEIIKLLPSEKNYGMQDNFIRTYLSCSGSFIALCEGDDYWVDEYKLQKQLDFLEKNKTCIATFHNSLVIEDGKTIGVVYKEHIGNITMKDLFYGKYMKTNTLMFRNLFSPSVEKVIDDTTLGMFLLDNGGYAHYIKETMSAYRIHEGGIESKVNAKKSFCISLKTNNLIEKIYSEKCPNWVNNSSLVFFTSFSIKLLSQRYVSLALKCFIRSFKYKSTLKLRSIYIYRFFKQFIKNVVTI